MCLTCVDCNHGASEAERAVAEELRVKTDGRWVTLSVPGQPELSGRLKVDPAGNMAFSASKPRTSAGEFHAALRSGEFTISGFEPKPHFARMPWLKAAYLSVFCLLGKYGYRYALGSAVEPVRRQIMGPREKITRYPVIRGMSHPGWQRDSILMNRAGRPCWLVKMGERLVPLPTSWDEPFYEWVEEEWAASSGPDGAAKITVEGGPLWYPAKFGQIRVASITLGDGSNPRDTIGFAAQAHATQGDKTVPFVFADYSGHEATVMITEGLG